jgi:hypothetical protein
MVRSQSWLLHTGSVSARRDPGYRALQFITLQHGSGGTVLPACDGAGQGAGKAWAHRDRELWRISVGLSAAINKSPYLVEYNEVN